MNYEKILWLKDKYINKTIVIIGCGTSLLDFDLNKIRKDIHIFTFNRFLQFFNYFWKDLKINSYLCHDRFTLFEPFSFFLKKKFIHLKLNFDEYEGINHELRDAKTSILDDAVVLELNYPIVINKGESVYELKDFSFRVRSRVDDYYEISQKTIVEQQKHAGSICISCLFDLSEEYDVKIEMRDSGNSTIITIVDEEYKLSEESYEWRFAIK